MISKYFPLLLLFLSATRAASQSSVNFSYNNGFQSSNLWLDGIAGYTSNGLLRLTNLTKQEKGHAFYPNSISFKNSSDGRAISFSTTFVCAIISEIGPTLSGHGIAFTIAPTRGLPGALASQYLGLFNLSNNGNDTNHVFAVELDTILSSEFNDTDDNHAGIDINSLKSNLSHTVGYYGASTQEFTKFSLISGEALQVWVDYNATETRIDVTLAPLKVKKPQIPLLSLVYDLTPILHEYMFVGFSSSTGSVLSSHYILGWSFGTNGEAAELDLSQLPKLPRIKPKQTSRFLTSALPVICVVVVVALLVGLGLWIRRKRKYAELVEEWELMYGAQRFKYKDLYVATKGFAHKGLLGSGGFGRVYKGVLPKSKLEVAVKRVSHESRQGMKEFVAEIVSIGRMKHRNLVTLLGYCRRKGELLLVYDYMPNGSLDKYIFDQPKVTLNWSQRFRVIKGVASGLFYLHEEWEQVVIHRDIKASNVLLDGEMNGRVGDFGLARLYDHGTLPQTTHVVGTLGYLAPEHSRTGKATTSTDVYAFGAFLLEVACGKRPLESQEHDFILVDWVYSCWKKGAILETIDVKLGSDYVLKEAELVLKLGLMCSVSDPRDRPSMRQAVQFLQGDVPLPDLSKIITLSGGLTFAHGGGEGFDDIAMSYPSFETGCTQTSYTDESLLSGGR